MVAARAAMCSRSWLASGAPMSRKTCSRPARGMSSSARVGVSPGFQNVCHWPRACRRDPTLLTEQSLRDGKPEIVFTRERFAMSEAMTYCEFTVDAALTLQQRAAATAAGELDEPPGRDRGAAPVTTIEVTTTAGTLRGERDDAAGVSVFRGRRAQPVRGGDGWSTASAAAAFVRWAWRWWQRQLWASAPLGPSPSRTRTGCQSPPASTR